MEHSLLSISEWESKYHKPFLTKDIKTTAEIFDYIAFMITDPYEYEDKVRIAKSFTKKDIDLINAYIEDPATATWFSKNQNGKKSREQTTSELIYYWMIAMQIPFECQAWHLNRLLTLIRVCSIKNEDPKKHTMSNKEIYRQNARLNAARKAALHTHG